MELKISQASLQIQESRQKYYAEKKTSFLSDILNYKDFYNAN